METVKFTSNEADAATEDMITYQGIVTEEATEDLELSDVPFSNPLSNNKTTLVHDEAESYKRADEINGRDIVSNNV